MSGQHRLAAADVAEGKASYDEAFSQEHLAAEKGTASEEKTEKK
jgi:hypothetical protein